MLTDIYPLEKCDKVPIPEGAFYLGKSDKEQSVGYLELNPKSSLNLHNRTTGIENLTQINGQCTMIVYDQPDGRIVKLEENDKLTIKPIGTWHIHCNPYDTTSLTYWDFHGDIMQIIEDIRKKS